MTVTYWTLVQLGSLLHLLLLLLRFLLSLLLLVPLSSLLLFLCCFFISLLPFGESNHRNQWLVGLFSMVIHWTLMFAMIARFKISLHPFPEFALRWYFLLEQESSLFQEESDYRKQHPKSKRHESNFFIAASWSRGHWFLALTLKYGAFQSHGGTAKWMVYKGNSYEHGWFDLAVPP